MWTFNFTVRTFRREVVKTLFSKDKNLSYMGITS